MNGGTRSIEVSVTTVQLTSILDASDWFPPFFGTDRTRVCVPGLVAIFREQGGEIFAFVILASPPLPFIFRFTAAAAILSSCELRVEGGRKKDRDWLETAFDVREYVSLFTSMQIRVEEKRKRKVGGGFLVE
ncbi:hypothetical protein TNCV_752991 [Trichonephila clavipes]|uniref:Uncharacterized protein n=1 Tax=Trichonephila clavipes TaxID=2585209 RepID=A0A8X6WBR3_TRICX|nr:hypothetical protein TNCV_752991 [Trichonephila clavipes]